MTVSAVLDSAGRRRSPATMPGSHAGCAPRNKRLRYPANPPTVEEIVSLMRQASDDRHCWRLRALVVLWRGGLRVQEALALGERDLDPRRGSLLVRHAKGGRRRSPDGGSRRTNFATPMPSNSCGKVPLNVIQRQLGHANLGTTSIYLQGIDTEEIIATVHARRAPMMSATAGLRF
jgi:integrase